MSGMNIQNLGAATAIGTGVGTAIFSATGESSWIGVGALLGILASIIKNNRPKKAKVRIKVKK